MCCFHAVLYIQQIDLRPSKRNGFNCVFKVSTYRNIYSIYYDDAQFYLLTYLPDVPIEWRIRFQLACLVHKILNTGHPPYLNELIQYHKPSRSTRLSASDLLSVPRHNLSFGARAFRVAVPKIWNSIPLHIRQSQTYSSFRRHLKTHHFISAHLAP